MPFGNRRSYKTRKSEEAGATAGRGPYEGEGTISRVEYQKTNPDRVNIFIEDEYAISLAAVLTAERKLKAGVHLSRSDIAELLAADLYNKGLTVALQLLAMRPRSESEVKMQLRKRYPDADSETISRVVERLQELNYLNDAVFARFWVENRSSFAPRGRNLLKQELMQKGVPRDIIDAVIETHLETLQQEADEEAGEEEAPAVEESQALEQARKKVRGLSGEDWPGFYRKLGGFLLRRGYNYEITSRVSKQLWQELKGQSSEDLNEV